MVSVRSSFALFMAETSPLVDENNALSARTEQQAASVEEAATSMVEMMQTVSSDWQNATQAAGMVSFAAPTAEGGVSPPASWISLSS